VLRISSSREINSMLQRLLTLNFDAFKCPFPFKPQNPNFKHYKSDPILPVLLRLACAHNTTILTWPFQYSESICGDPFRRCSWDSLNMRPEAYLCLTFNHVFEASSSPIMDIRYVDKLIVWVHLEI